MNKAIMFSVSVLEGDENKSIDKQGRDRSLILSHFLKIF